MFNKFSMLKDYMQCLSVLKCVQELHDTNIFIIDEATMVPNDALREIDILLRNIFMAYESWIKTSYTPAHFAHWFVNKCVFIYIQNETPWRLFYNKSFIVAVVDVAF